VSVGADGEGALVLVGCAADVARPVAPEGFDEVEWPQAVIPATTGKIRRTCILVACIMPPPR
jgi:hypothetical protein